MTVYRSVERQIWLRCYFYQLSQDIFVFVFDLQALLFKRIAYFQYIILLLAKYSLKLQSLQPQPFCLCHRFLAALHIHLFLLESLLLAVFVFCYIKTRIIISSVSSFHGYYNLQTISWVSWSNVTPNIHLQVLVL